MARMTKEELLEKLFHDDYEHLKGKKLRMTRVRVPGKEVCMAHIISPSDTRIYQNLALHIGVHEGEDHTGESIGLMRFTPWEAVVVAADTATKRNMNVNCFRHAILLPKQLKRLLVGLRLNQPSSFFFYLLFVFLKVFFCEKHRHHNI